jgi:hypothetical protein
VTNKNNNENKNLKKSKSKLQNKEKLQYTKNLKSDAAILHLQKPKLRNDVFICL